ncbi:DUF1266 domain-containing protein [Rheinheimera baltica]|uniref:DUF1266 domain-containing protein n=1 Tax=Rheinheimera baltica TaxID=67576 RepID=A0ABT9I4E0_9GAMM|nr:DUF1266 domain-containing protein [Rheinheimera baltica]MDP5138247.1 DUF1266 domain-containing protein [Rheinheimera baltica]MDP5151171.1 DUF1266 domain-containing protein [Rheinheimera baltica]
MTQLYNPEGYQPHQLWSLGLSAILTQVNSQRHDVLLHNDAETFSRVLSGWWDIVDRITYFENVQWLVEQGHRQVFNSLFQAQILVPEHEWRLTAEALKQKNPKQYQREMLVRHYRSVIGTGGIAAWDLGRVTSLARMAATCGYISTKEAWNEIYKQAEVAKNFFNNWFEYGHSYLIGRQFAMGNLDDEKGKNTIAITQLLLTSDDSPWCRHPQFSQSDRPAVHGETLQ